MVKNDAKTVFSGRETALRDGRTIRIRPARREDAGLFKALTFSVIEAKKGSMQLVEEAPETDARALEIINQYETKGMAHGALLVAAPLGPDGAETGEELAGELSAKRIPLIRLRHNAYLGLGVAPNWQGVGVGRALMEAVIDWAKWTREVDPPGVLRLELCTISDNFRAIALYESLGFVLDGRRERKVRDPDGTFRDDLEMSLWL